MSSTAFARWLSREGAHHDVVSWAEAAGVEWPEAWARCPRGDWMLGIALRLGVTGPALVAGALGCAREVEADVDCPEGRAALALAAAFVQGQDDGRDAQAIASAAEARAASLDDAAAAAATLAAAAACQAIVDPGAAPAAARCAIEAAVAGVGDCAIMAALGHMQARCAAAVRAALPCPPLPT